jgi:hypothetical protein
MVYNYEIWLANSRDGTVSIFVDDKEHIYEIPDKKFEIYLNCGIAVRFIKHNAGIISTGGELPRVFWDGDMEWVTFKSDIGFEWVVMVPMNTNNVTAFMEGE